MLRLIKIWNKWLNCQINVDSAHHGNTILYVILRMTRLCVRPETDFGLHARLTPKYPS
jgi:hypothetical protein